MKISLFNNIYLHLIKKYLEKDGHTVLINKYTPDVDLCISENIVSSMYNVYKILKKIKRNKTKLINLITEVSIDKIQYDFPTNTYYKYFKQFLYHNTHKHAFLSEYINQLKPNPNKGYINNRFNKKIQEYFNTRHRNRLYILMQYRNYLKKSNLNLSISKFTQKLAKKFLKLNSMVCYGCVNSDFLNSFSNKHQNTEIKYDAINISRISHRKHQEVFVRAANKLGLNVLVIGRHQDKSIKLDCPHFYLPDYKDVATILTQTRLYVDASIFEGFGMTPIEAAFLDKISIVSNTFLHRDVLGDYPLYFEIDNVDDLVDKMRIVLNGEYKLNNVEIKKKYSIEALKNRLIEYIESIM